MSKMQHARHGKEKLECVWWFVAQFLLVAFNGDGDLVTENNPLLLQAMLLATKLFLEMF